MSKMSKIARFGGPRDQRNALGMIVHPVVFYASAALIIGIVFLTILNTQQIDTLFSTIQEGMSTYFGWLYVLAMNLFLVFTVFLGFSRYGNIRLGGPDAEPDFSIWGWFAMLFSAGMGIGLLFFGVAEPIYHYGNNPLGADQNGLAARDAMTITFYHWGLHAWGVYALVGLSLAFFGFTRNLPLTIRSAFYPILGDRVRGWIGNTIDTLAVVATLFGVATSLGLGVQQVSAGLEHLFDIEQTTTVMVLLIAGITGMATISVVLGLDAGIQSLSKLNIVLAGLLMFFLLAVGPTLFLLDNFVQNLGNYVQRLPSLAFWTEGLRGEDAGWQNSWTIFYWAWWIAWSPFVGMFIARISRGRTIREFITGVLLVPVVVSFLWLTVFGGTALHNELFGPGTIAAAVNESLDTSIYVLFEGYPLAVVTSILAMIVVIVFFVTSSDSGSFVIDIITSGGHENPPVGQRVFWAVLEGVVAAVLLVAGGLGALQTASITAGLPFAIVLLVMCYSLVKGLRREYAQYGSIYDRQADPTIPDREEH